MKKVGPMVICYVQRTAESFFFNKWIIRRYLTWRLVQYITGVERRIAHGESKLSVILNSGLYTTFIYDMNL